MKTLFYILWLVFSCVVFAQGLAADQTHGQPEPSADAPALTDVERSLPFFRQDLRWDDSGQAFWEIHGKPVHRSDLDGLSPWQVMTLIQQLTGAEVPLSRFGDVGSVLWRAWTAKLASYLAALSKPAVATDEDLFDPTLSVWDPGYVQFRNSLRQWYIRLFSRNIVESDIATLSPLEVAQAVEVLTGRRYTTEFVLKHLEAFRAQLRIERRLETPGRR